MMRFGESIGEAPVPAEQEKESSIYDQFNAQIVELKSYTEKLATDSPEFEHYINVVTAALGFAHIMGEDPTIVKTKVQRDLLKLLNTMVLEATELLVGEASRMIHVPLVNSLFEQIDRALLEDMGRYKKSKEEKKKKGLAKAA